MGLNELLLIATGFLSVFLVSVAWKIDKERLHGVIFLFLVLISISGGKIVEFFGHETNTGNVFYASVFLAVYLMMERYGKREGVRATWVAVAAITAFTVFLQIVVALEGSSATRELDAAIASAFHPVSRLAIASMLGFIVAQSFNAYFYSYLKDRFDRKYLWHRINASHVLAQLLDSVVFFTVAFWGVVPPENIGDIMATGFVIKVVFVMVTSWIVYLNRMELEEGEGYATLTLR